MRTAIQWEKISFFNTELTEKLPLPKNHWKIHAYFRRYSCMMKGLNINTEICKNEGPVNTILTKVYFTCVEILTRRIGQGEKC